MKKMRLLALMLLLAFLFTGCGATAKESASANGADHYYRAEAPEATVAVADSESGTTAQANLPANQKLIRTIWLNTETEDMNTMLSAVEAKVAQLEGYIENRSLQNGSMHAANRARYGSLTIRIPAQNLNEFITHMSGISNVVSNRETTEDVTLSYVEHESRVTALETEQSRLLELLAKAETMEDILQIEGRLTQIRSELEAAKSKLRVYDNLVNYGTIHLEITEVQEYTVEEPEPTTLWERLCNGLATGWKALTGSLGHILVFLTTALPALLTLAVATGVILFVRKRCRKKKASATAEEASDPREKP